MHTMQMDPESAFCAGILHDIGKLIFEQFAEMDFSKACAYAVDNRISLLMAEREIMGITHAEIGKILADKWALPVDLESTIVLHHSPQDADSARELVTTVHLADQMAHKAGYDLWDNEKIEPEWMDALSVLGLDENMFENFLKELENDIDKPTEFLIAVNYAE